MNILFPDLPLINTEVYSLPLIVLFLTGCVMWVVAYIIIVRNIIKYQFVEMPTVAGCGNFAWEILWSTVFIPNMGLLCLWGYRSWMLLDIYIFSCVLRSIAHENKHPLLIDWNKALVIIALLAWGAAFYFFTSEHFDTPLGANSAYVLNVVISVLYPLRLLRRKSLEGFSYAVAWLKMIGTGLISVFMILYYSENHFLHVLCVIVFLADVMYILLFHALRSKKLAFADISE